MADTERNSSSARRTSALGGAALLATGSASLLLTALALPASAATTFVVDDAVDGPAQAADCTTPVAGQCSLRDAAAAAVDGDSITFAPALSAITLDSGTVAFPSVSITGPGSANLTITSAKVSGEYDIFQTSGATGTTISGVTVSGNRVRSRDTGTFALDDVRITGSTRANVDGAALYTGGGGNVTITDSRFDGNVVQNQGGAIYFANSGTVVVTGSTIDGNTSQYGCGGGIYIASWPSSTTITGSTISGNDARYGCGGGIFVKTPNPVNIVETTMDYNSTYLGGAALYSNGRYGPTVSIIDSTLSDNTANDFASASTYGGGAIWINNGALIISNSTITGNETLNGNGGALYSNAATVTINQSTITENTAALSGGIFAGGFANQLVSLNGSILAGNIDDTGAADFAASSGGSGVTTLESDHSIFGTGVQGFTYSDLGGTIRTATPGVLALADNGGPTKTMALDPSSPAIDAGPNPVPTPPGDTFDQRGATYLRVVNGTVDIGAYEVQAETPPSTTSTTSTPVPSTTTTMPDGSSTTTGRDDEVAPEFTG